VTSRSATPLPEDRTMLEASRWANRAVHSRLDGDRPFADLAASRARQLARELPSQTRTVVTQRLERPDPWRWQRAGARAALELDDALLDAELALRLGDREDAEAFVDRASSLLPALPPRTRAEAETRTSTVRRRTARVRPDAAQLREEIEDYERLAQQHGGAWGKHYADLARMYAERLPDAAERRETLNDLDFQFSASRTPFEFIEDNPYF
jgi:hypothetical protein